METFNKQKQPHSSVLRQWVVVIMTLTLIKTGKSSCAYDAIFNFGDSNSDTGGFWAAFPSDPTPNGMTYFNRPSGRSSDGRLIIDFIAQAFRFPLLSPYLQSTGSDYSHGVNFATFLSTVLPEQTLMVRGISPFTLAIQLNQMKRFKMNVDQQKLDGYKKLPKPGIFGKSLYIFYIGQNDFTGVLLTSGTNELMQFFPQVISELTTHIKELYGLGGRTFMVQNLAPIGCYPVFLVLLPHNNSDVDEFGCMISYNNLVVEYNNMLKQALNETRQQLLDAQVIYVDTHSVILDIIQHPTSHGLTYGTKACCGFGGGAYNFSPQLFCGGNAIINGENVNATACPDPYNYISWDGLHLTEAANKILALAILNGSLFDPPFPLQSLCKLVPIS